MGFKERYEERKKQAVSNPGASSVKTTSQGGFRERYLEKQTKTDLAKGINFDTLQSDLTSLSDTIGSVYNGWQSRETLENTRSSIESMFNRLGKYQEYQQKYGGTDLSELQKAYKSALDGWDDISKHYGQYKDADTYTKETTKLGELGAMTSSDVEKARNDAAKEIEKLGLEDKLKTAKEYEQNIKKLTNSAMNIRNPSAVKPFSEAVKKATEERDNYLKSIGYDSLEAIENALSGKNIAYTTVGGENITWQSLYDTKKYNEDSDALYKEISSRDDFEKYKTEGANVKNPTFDDAELGISIAGWNPFAKDVQNKVEYAIENETLMDMNGRSDDTKYASVTSQERDIYNYHLGRERAGLAEKGTADAYLESIGGVLKDRYEDKSISKLTQYADEHPVLSSVASVWQSLASGVEFVGDGINYLATGELDDNYYARASSAIRGTVSDKVDWEIGNWDAFDFVYNTGMSMADSMVSMAALGSAGGVALGLSAAAQGTNDALARGLDNKSAFWSGISAGVFEAAFESLSIGKFKALKEAPVDSVKTIIKNVGKSMLTNASEETLTEIANILYDNIANADLSQAKTKMRAYVSAGMSEKEAASKVASEQALQVVEAGASGALMGLGFGGIAGGSAYNKSKHIGQGIKANERVGELFDIASDPEVASAYETYTRYANKGINADNITDAQLGRLYTEARADVQTTLDSKKSTPEQIKSAEKIKADLDVYAQDNPSARVSKKIAKNVNDEESIKALIESGLESGENTESFKLATEYRAKLDSGKKLSTNEISKLIEANEKAFKNEELKDVAARLVEEGESTELADIVTRKMRGETITTEEAEKVMESDAAQLVIAENSNAENVTDELVATAKTMDKEKGALFVALYDGETDIEAYTNAFNLVTAKAENNFTFDNILQHSNVLSGEQISKIYSDVRIKVDHKQTLEIQKLAEKTANLKAYKAVIDDSVIDYENASSEGKVNWKDLDDRTRKAITFVKGFAQATGINLTLVTDGKAQGFNGAFIVNDNTIVLDVFAGKDIDANKLLDTIIPTMSHEVTHWMEKKSPVLYRRLNEIVFSTLQRFDGLTEDERIAKEISNAVAKEYKKQYEKENPGKRISVKDALKKVPADVLNEARTDSKRIEVARSEIIARACEDMLSMSEQGKKMFYSLSESEQKTLKDKIIELIQNLKDWVSELLGLYKSGSYEAKIMRAYEEDLNELLKVWDAMLVKSVEANQALEKSGAYRHKTSAEGGTLYALREEAIAEVEQAISDKNYDKEIKLTDSSPAILTSQKGVKNLPMMMVASHVRENILTEKEAKNLGLAVNSNKHYHGLGKDLFLKVIGGLDNVTEAYRGTKNAEKSERRENYFLLISQYKDSNGNTINVPVYVNEHGIYNRIFVDTNKIATVFGRNELKAYIKKQVAEGNLVRIKNRSTQASESTPLIDGDYSKNASKDSILNPVENVKEKFSDRDSTGRELSNGQKEYFKDSVVRDEDGNLLVMYRGDSNEFTVFDRKKTNYSNLYGRGFYFTKRKEHAEQYGASREFYLDIKNPLSPKQNVITKEQMLNFLKAIENDGEDYDLYNYGQEATAESVLNSVWGKGDFEMLQDINAGAIGDLVAAVELFNEVNGTSYDGIVLPTETVTFNSEQAKLTSNLNPTKDKDMRFSMRDNVEETKDLVAVHNMQVSELERTLDLGGLPMPSIAIIKAKSGHSEYGDVSLVFPKSTIDPKADKNNKVYGGDAWTPTYPKIEYKPNAKIAQKISDKYYELSRRLGYDESRPLYNYVYDLEEQLNRNKGEAELLEELYDDQNMMQLYLLDSGKGKVETIQKETRTELTDAEVEMNEFFISELGADVVDAIVWDGNGTPMSYRKNYLSKHEDAIRDAYKKLLSERYQFTDEQVQNVLDGTKASDLIKFMRDANKYRQNGRVTTKTEADYEATKQAIKDASADGYKAWVDSLFKGVEEKSGIRNNTDYFTNSGNRRSWEALHWENNLENVVRVMKSQDNGVAALFSGHAIWAVSAKDYRSVEEIKADADRLKRLSEEEYSEIKQGFGTRFQEIAESIMSKSESNPFIAADNAMSCIVEAVRNSKTKSGLLKNLREYSQLTVTETTADDILSLVSDISNMPTEYFEAKPRRAVELNEIATAIIPDTTSDSTKARLNDMRIKYLEYENGNEQSRLDALNSLEEVRFSDRDSDGDILYSKKDYSYDTLVAKPDMKLTALDGNVPNNRADIIYQAKKNAAKVGSVNPKDKTVSVHVDDIGRDIVLGTDGLQHGMARGKNIQNRPIGIVTLKAGEIIKHSIRINELNPSKESATGAYILIGAAIDDEGNLYLVRSVVNEYGDKLASMDVLYAINTKKESAMLNASRYAKNSLSVTDSTNRLRSMRPEILPSVTDSTISIAELLDYVNKYFPDILPESVLRHYGYDARPASRPNDKLGESVLFSDRDDTSVYDLMGETERLKKENERFKADVERLRERLKIERQVTHGNYFNENQIGAVAGHIRNIAKSSYDKVTLMRDLKDVYSFIAQSQHLTWEEVFMKCCRIADSVLSEAKPVTMTDDYSKQILRDIKNTSISFSETQKQEAKYLFGKHWNRSFFGRTTITDSGVPLESMWQDWAGQYPHLFDADVTEGDMVGELYNILNNLQEASEIVMEYDEEEQIRWLAREIYNQYWNVSNIKTTADKYDKQIKLLNFEHRKAMAEFRSEYEDRVEKQKLVDDMYYRRKMSEQKGKFNAELVAQRKAQQERYQNLYRDLRERKDTEIALAKQHGREMVDKYRDNAERKTRIQSITANAMVLNEMLIKNSKDKHVPEILKEPVTAMLQALDFSSKRLLEKGVPTQKDISLSRSLNKVKDMMVKATNAHNDLVELYGHGLDEDIEKMVDSVDNIRSEVGDNEFVLNQMTAQDLQTLDKMVKTIRHAVNKLNTFHTVNHAKGIANLSKESVAYLDSLGKGKIYDGLKGKAKKLLDWGNTLPYYVFKRFGSGGTKVYEALQDGWDKFAFNTKKIIDYANETYTSKEAKEWSEEVKTFKVLVPASELDMASPDYTPQYQEVQLTVPQIMSMYCLSKREQAKKHLFQGGIRVADFKTKKGEIVSQSDGIIFTEKDVSAILNSLTGRQKAVADKLQKFMNTVSADWGNDVSMARFGYKAFGEENYFPIQSDQNNLAVNDETEQPNSLFKLLNMSFTKNPIENANNRIVISDIFDVFAQHTSDMAKYNALALPVLDSFKWYNYTEKQDVAEGTFKTKGVKQSIEKAFGKDGQSYFTTFLKDINGQQEVSRDTLGKGFFKNAKIASVGANLRVMLLQPTSYVRASAVIDNKYLTKALGYKPKIKKAEEYCGIALWKSMGYYDTNVQRGVEEQIKHNDTWKDKAVEWSMKGAEVADKITWGYLWNACELEIRDTRKDLKVGSKEFYDAISKRLREVIYATQVVDSTMTRSQMMRSGDWRDKMLTAFASEPTLSYNMLQDAYMAYSLDARRMGKAEAIKKNGKHIARVVYAYTMTNAVAALVESAFDAYRDDDDEEMDMIEFMKLYFKNFALDMSIGNKIPYVKDLYSLLQGYSSSRMDTQWAQYFYNAMNAKKPSKKISYWIRTISQLSGLPFYNMYRDTMATLNKLDLFTEEDLNEMFEDFLD